MEDNNVPPELEEIDLTEKPPVPAAKAPKQDPPYFEGDERYFPFEDGV